MSGLFRTFLRQAEQISGSATYDDALTVSGAETYLAKSLEKDLNYLRSQVKAIIGEDNWYDALDTTLSDAAIFSAAAQTFTGMDSASDNSPSYSSQEYITDGEDLEEAIGALDLQVKANEDGYTALTLDKVCDVGATTDQAIVSTGSGSSFASLLDTGNLDVWGDITVDGDILVEGTVDGVDVAGFASAAQTFTGMDSASDSTPSYTSQVYVTNSDSLETAIGKLDAAITLADVVKEIERLSAQVNSGSAHAVPGSHSHAAGDGSTMDVYLNGQLLQSNTGTELRDYLESASDQVKFTFDVPTNSYLTYLIRS